MYLVLLILTNPTPAATYLRALPGFTIAHVVAYRLVAESLISSLLRWIRLQTFTVNSKMLGAEDNLSGPLRRSLQKETLSTLTLLVLSFPVCNAFLLDLSPDAVVYPGVVVCCVHTDVNGRRVQRHPAPRFSFLRPSGVLYELV